MKGQVERNRGGIVNLCEKVRGSPLISEYPAVFRNSAASLIVKGLNEPVDMVKSVTNVGRHPDPMGAVNAFRRHGDPISLIEVEAFESRDVKRRD